MKKVFFLLIACLGCLGLAHADILTLHHTPATQTAISGSIVTFTVTGSNGTEGMYVKYLLPAIPGYALSYQNASQTPINEALLTLGVQDDPIFFVAANSSFTITISAKVITDNRSLPPLDPICTTNDTLLACSLGDSTCPMMCLQSTTIYTHFSSGSDFTTISSGIAFSLTPIADLVIHNVLAGDTPSISGDTLAYTVTLHNQGSRIATGISFVSTFPIPAFTLPTATFDGVTYPYSSIIYPQDFVWNGTYLESLLPGQVMTIVLNSTMANQLPVGTPFTHTARVITPQAEYTTGNNLASVSGRVAALPDLWVTQSAPSFAGYQTGSIVTYIVTYGNSGGQAASDVHIIDTLPAEIFLSTPTYTLGTLAAGSGGTLILTGTLQGLYMSGHTFTNTVYINTSSREPFTGNNISHTVATIPSISIGTILLSAHNISRPQLDNSPYGSGSDIRIQAVSGDIVELTLSYTHAGNTSGYQASLHLSDILGFVSLSSSTHQIGNLLPYDQGSFVVTGVVGPNNYLSFSPRATLSYNTGTAVSDTVIIQEPFVCGDGLLTRNEPCDTQGNLGVLYSGQVCENQQGICVLVTKSIVNTACITYQYTSPLGGITTGHVCDDVDLNLTDPTCATMTSSTPLSTTLGYDVLYTCTGRDTLATTPITIDCGNGTQVDGFGSLLQGTCHYTSAFVGQAQCKVGNDLTNPTCKVPVALDQGKCEDLDALDGSVLLVNDDDEAEGNFRCETVNGVEAPITIDCGNGDRYTTFGSVFEHMCSYDYDPEDDDADHEYTVTCYVDNFTNPACTEKIIVDDGGLSYCGNGIREGYEDCDDGEDNGTSHSNCSEGCDLAGSTMVGCFNVGNTNISIQKGEILPFRWTLDSTDNIVDGNSCKGEDDGSIPEDSIMCTFHLYNGNDTEIDDDGRQQPIYTLKKKCNENSRGSHSVFDYFLDKQDIWRSLKHAFGKYYIDGDDMADIIDDTFGEYKIALDKVEYKYCLGDDKEVGTVLDRVCNTDFAVTQPYVAQKSSFGITPKAASITLDGYTSLLGEDLISKTDLKDIMVLDDSDYNGGDKVKTLITNFITKYNKLAVAVPESKLRGTIFAGLGVNVKIVPQQKIYILHSSTQKTITLKDMQNFTTPFTIVTQNIDLVVKGNIASNGMFLVKNGTITFAPSDRIIGGDMCPETQTVKGIFVTDKGFVGGPSLANTRVDRLRCTYGGLSVQGILIGDNIDAIAQAKRSQLNHWFMVGASSEASVKAERRNEIFRGASVLIEYSPSLWSALPPGASDFTKVLDIYKK